jgi:multiple sugar transport system permease protein
MNKLLIYLFVILLLLWIGIPIYWVLKTSFSPETEVWERGLPTNPTLQNYIDVLSPTSPKGKMAEVVGTYAALSASALTPLFNSLRVAILTVLLTLLASITTAYNLARFSYRGKRFVSSYILFAYIFPGFILMVPIMYLLNLFNALNNLTALSIVQLAYTTPFSVYMLRGYFMGIPKELEEAAMVDGCTRFQVIRKVVLPLALPGLVTVAVFSFTMSWGDVVFPLILLRTADNYTLPLYMSFYLWGGEITDPGRLSALTIVSAMIPVVLFMSIQRFVKMGLVAGAVKA